MVRWDPPKAEGYRLYESQNDGTLRFLKDEAGAWKFVQADQRKKLLERERLRLDAHNEWIGKYRGKTIVIFGTGPMLRRITAKQAKWLGDNPNIIVAGVNAAPGIAKKIWRVNPTRVFDFVFAGDYSALSETYPEFKENWCWNDLGNVIRFVSGGAKFDGTYYPCVGSSIPKLCLPKLGWHNSLSGAINLAIMALAEPSPYKECAGPWCDWPQRLSKPAIGGKIILVGLEMNHRNHAYSKEDSFGLLDGRKFNLPGSRIGDAEGPMADLRFVREGYETIARFGREMNVQILNAAPWSMVKAFPFCDFEEELDLPVRSGVSSDGIPEKRIA